MCVCVCVCVCVRKHDVLPRSTSEPHVKRHCSFDLRRLHVRHGASLNADGRKLNAAKIGHHLVIKLLPSL